MVAIGANHGARDGALLINLQHRLQSQAHFSSQPENQTQQTIGQERRYGRVGGSGGKFFWIAAVFGFANGQLKFLQHFMRGSFQQSG